MRKLNLPIFIPHRGCPHDCAFCSQRKITGVDTEVKPEDIQNLLEEFIETVDTENSNIEVAFFGGSFTALDVLTQESFLKVAARFYPVVDGIRISTRPDCIDESIIELLKSYGVTTIELGVQSSNDAVLALNTRGHNFNSVKESSKIIKDAGITLGLQMMVGMYGSTPEMDIKTAVDIIKLTPSCVRIYPVITLKGTKLERLYQEGSYKPYSVEEAAEVTKTIVKMFNEAGIEVIRIGLHSSEELETPGNIIAGPYHPAFGEIVESLIYREQIEEELLEKRTQDDEFVFYCKRNQISKAIGHKGMNKKYFNQKYNVRLRVRAKEE